MASQLGSDSDDPDAEERADGEEQSESGSDDEKNRWCEALHRLVNEVLGDCPKRVRSSMWYYNNDDEFMEAEERRRGLLRGVLAPILRQPYYSDFKLFCDFKACKTTRGDGILFGTGEKLGEWDVFTLFFTKPQADKYYSLEVGQEVTVGKHPFTEDAVVARILRGTKSAGRAADAKTQLCYYVLLKTKTGFNYASLQHVNCECVCDSGVAQAWVGDCSHEGYLPKENQLASFRAKSVSAVAQAAARYVTSLEPAESCDSSDDEQTRRISKPASDCVCVAMTECKIVASLGLWPTNEGSDCCCF
jgi:hypothetical protein